MKTIKELEELLKDSKITEFEETIDLYYNNLKKEGFSVSYKTLAAMMLLASNKIKSKDAKVNHGSSDIKLSAKEGVIYQRFFITLGSKDKVSKLDIIDIIKSKVEGLSTTDFADVYILETYSFFEVDGTKKNEILSSVEGMKYNGREVHIEFSEMRKKENKPKQNYVKSEGKKYYKS